MLTGVSKPSSGRIQIRPSPINVNTSPSESTIGMCPQHDVLWDLMTVRQHLELYAGIKGVPASQIKRVVEEDAQKCGLADKIDARIDSLSGGQKRKCSVGIAFVGGSRTVVLDEPTAGMVSFCFAHLSLFCSWI